MLKNNYLNILLNLLFCKQAFLYFIKRRKIRFREKQKMLKGELYSAGLDISLYCQKQFCKKQCFKFNSLSPEKIIQRNSILTKLLGKIGKSFLIEQPFLCDYGYNIEIGENFCSGHNLLILDPAKVTFGNNVFVGPNCGFYTSIHPIDAETRELGIEYAKPITVGNNVWFGANVSVLPGVSIGDNAVIGAGSVVNKDIPSNTMAAGNPCAIIKNI